MATSAPIHADLIERIERHCEAVAITPRAFGVQVMNDPRLVFDMRKGRELRQRSIKRIIEAIEAGEQ